MIQEQHNGNIDPRKVDKYLLKLLNGDTHKLESFLPNLLATQGIMEREALDYRTSQFKKKDPHNYNTKIANVLNKIEHTKQSRNELILALAELKHATNQHYQKTRRPPLIP
jgi:hypothetical protein